ncbi:hypothetical protein IFR05_013306 [Cadophora sp. M221]|nr:hypothetical protein IFR05_013306 [Cadophora sp. M221]
MPPQDPVVPAPKFKQEKVKPKKAKSKSKTPVEEPEALEVEFEKNEDEDDDEELPEGEYVVEKITNHIIDEGTGEIKYEVKWEGFEKRTDRTWEPEENLETASGILSEYLASVGGKELIMSAWEEKKAEAAPGKKKAQAASGKRGQRETIAEIAELWFNGTTDDKYHQVRETMRRLETKLENGPEATLHHNGSFDESLDQALQLIENIAKKASVVLGTIHKSHPSSAKPTNEPNVGSSSTNHPQPVSQSASNPSQDTQPPGDPYASTQEGGGGGGGGGDGAVPMPSAPDAVHPSSAMSAPTICLVTDHSPFPTPTAISQIPCAHNVDPSSTNIISDTQCTKGFDPGYLRDGGDGSLRGVKRNAQDEAPQQNSIYSYVVHQVKRIRVDDTPLNANQAIDSPSPASNKPSSPLHHTGTNPGGAKKDWRSVTGIAVSTLPKIPKIPKIPKGILSQESQLKPFSPPTTIFLSTLHIAMVEAELEFVCLRSDSSDTASILMSNSGCGIRVCLSLSISGSLAEWLGMQALHGEIVEAAKLCEFLKSWLFQNLENENSPATFEGLSRTADQWVTLRRPDTCEKVQIMFNNRWFNFIGRMLIQLHAQTRQ